MGTRFPERPPATPQLKITPTEPVVAAASRLYTLQLDFHLWRRECLVPASLLMEMSWPDAPGFDEPDGGLLRKLLDTKTVSIGPRYEATLEEVAFFAADWMTKTYLARSVVATVSCVVAVGIVSQLVYRTGDEDGQ